MTAREVFSRFWYVATDDCVFGPSWGDYSWINETARGKDETVLQVIRRHRMPLLTRADIREAKVIMRAKGLENPRAFCVTIYEKGCIKKQKKSARQAADEFIRNMDDQMASVVDETRD